MEPVKIATGFKYVNFDGAKGAVFSGAVFADENGMYLIHNKHTWESGVAATAAFGLIGAVIHHYATRNKKIEYPFPTLPVSEIGESLQTTLGTGKFKDDAEVSIVTKDQIRGFSKSTFKGSKFYIGEIEIVLVGVLGKAMKQLPDFGYVQNE